MRLESWMLWSIIGVLTHNQSNQKDHDDKVIVGYYVPWGGVEPEDLSLNKVTHMNYAFGVLTKSDDPASIAIDRHYDGDRIRKLKTHADKFGTKVLISLGGWTGSQTFSTAVKDKQLRTKFINNALVFLRNNTQPESDENPDGWNLDGIDIDWEYPGRPGAICNQVDPQDSANYLVLLKELREAMDLEFPNEHKLLTAAVRVEPFDGPDKKPMSDVTAFVPYFDFINIMTYDVNGAFSDTTGPNAPFVVDSRGGKPYSFVQAIDDWMAAGFPANKLTGGIAFYGRSVTTKVAMTKDNMYVYKEKLIPKGDPSDADEESSLCKEGKSFSGVWKYKYLRQSILKTSPTRPTDNYTRYYDPITETPWLFNPITKTFISYDDPESIRIKLRHLIKLNLRGVMFWDISQDYQDELLDTLQLIRTSTSPCYPSSSPSPPPPPCRHGHMRCAPGITPQFLICRHGQWHLAQCRTNFLCQPHHPYQVKCERPTTTCPRQNLI